MSSASSEVAAPSRAAWATRFPERFCRKISQGAYRPEIDGLRFFAIAFVIFGHSLERAARFFPSYQRTLAGTAFETFFQLAPPGVFLFFAISGFILAGQAQKAKASPLSPTFLKSYFGRRVLRIEPPYIVLLVATWALISLTHWSPEGVRRFDVAPSSLNVSLVSSLFYLHDLVWGTFPRLFPPGWSLEVEVQFYLLAPLLFALFAVLQNGSDRIALVAVLLVNGVSLSLLDLKALGPVHVEYSLLRYCNYFLVGVALSYFQPLLATAVSRLSRAGVTALGWGGLALFIAAAAPAEQDATGIEVVRLFTVYAGLAALFTSTFDPRSGFRAFCAAPWISLIGGACYSLYLVHLQIVQMTFVIAAKLAPSLPLAGVALVFAVAAAAVVAIGLVYYVQIERRFMAKDWPADLAAYVRGGARSAKPVSGIQLAVDNSAAAMPSDERMRRALQRRSAATKP